MNELLTIAERLQTQLQAIDGSSAYNNNIKDSHIIVGFELLKNAVGYPSIYVGYIRENITDVGDQVVINCPFEVEIYGYVQSNDDSFKEAIKLASDMIYAIRTDETLNGSVYDLETRYEVATLDDLGVVIMTVQGKFEYTKP